MLEATCPCPETPVKNAMKHCNLMKRYLGRKNKPQDATNTDAAKNVKHDDFPKEDGTVMMIFGGTPARPPRCKHKCILQEIYHTKSVVPSYLRWSEMVITYDWAITPTTFHNLGLPPRGSTALYYQAGAQGAHGRGSSLNIVYMSTLDSMGIQ
jgi:hypothetical protein